MSGFILQSLILHTALGCDGHVREDTIGWLYVQRIFCPLMLNSQVPLGAGAYMFIHDCNHVSLIHAWSSCFACLSIDSFIGDQFFLSEIDISMYCLRVSVEKLKPRTGKTTTEDQLNTIICFGLVRSLLEMRQRHNCYYYRLQMVL